MSDFHQIINQHLGLLAKKGYDSHSLNSFSSKDQTKLILEDLLTQCVLSKAFDQHLNQPLRFDLPVTGFFAKDKDIVFFKLSYAYDRTEQTLAIDSLSGSMLSAEMAFDVKGQTPSALPHAQQVYQVLKDQLKEQRTGHSKILPAPPKLLTADQQLRLHGSAVETIERLHRLGYIPTEATKSTDTLLDDLKTNMLRISARPTTANPLFVLHYAALYDGFTEPVGLRLLMNQNTYAHRVQLTAVEGNLNGIRVSTFHNERTPLPPAEILLAELAGKERRKKAQQILDRTSLLKKSKLLRHGA